jgi:hypothetical protein
MVPPLEKLATLLKAQGDLAGALSIGKRVATIKSKGWLAYFEE